MSDWGMYELEDIVWDELGGSDDHIVPHPGGAPANECVAQVDYHKKQRCDAASAIGRIIDNKNSGARNVVQEKENNIIHPILEDGNAPMLEKGSWSHAHGDVFPASCDDDYIASVGAKASNNCFNSSNDDSVGNDFCTDDPLLGDRADTVDSNLCDLQLDDISPENCEFKFFGNEDEHKENNDLLDYGWPDIGNFEDVDRMFRNSDSTFGLGSATTANELSWFSASSHVIDGSEDALKSGFISSSSGSSVLQSENDMEVMHGSDPPTADHTKENDSNTFQVNMQMKHKTLHQLGGKRKDHSLEGLNGTVNGVCAMEIPAGLELPCPPSVPKSTSQIISKQRQLWVPDSLNYFNSYIPYGHPEYSLPSNQSPGMPTVSNVKNKGQNHLPLSCIVSTHASKSAQPVKSSDPHSKPPATMPEEKMKKLHQRKQIQAKLNNENHCEHFICQPAFCGHAPGQKQLHETHNEVGADSVVEETGTGLSAVEIDSSTVQKSSYLGSVLSDEISLEATGFRQLQDVMEQLDIRTKLCIRDSLYRLARSAEQRHNFSATNGTSIDDRVKSGAPAVEESNMYTRCMDAETNTNPIDRSIAHLLFYRPSEPSVRQATDAISLESHIAINGTGQPVMPDQQVSQKDIPDDTDTRFLTNSEKTEIVGNMGPGSSTLGSVLVI